MAGNRVLASIVNSPRRFCVWRLHHSKKIWYHAGCARAPGFDAVRALIDNFAQPADIVMHAPASTYAARLTGIPEEHNP
jgi:hypothetical protein